ncbi:ScbR family autoregulator-binding transcription factor [Streptomyces sp. HUAS MG47]|uniref:ScbR family autoregulator-binding transcription factor n=1 Tax=Streptomyces solicamelliae TaxID=3231716 RepID=UPI0038779566
MVRQERAIRTRQRILAVAAEVFDEAGYDATTISDILKRSGLTKGALYFHFTSKEDIAQAVLAAQVDALPQVPPQELKLQQSMDEALLLAHLLQPETGDPIIQAGVRLTVDQGTRIDNLQRRTAMDGWTERTRALLEEAKACGETLPHVDTDGLAKLLVGSFTGVQVLSRIMTGRRDLTERVTDLYRHLMPTVAVPGVLVRLDFSPDRGVRVYETVMKQRAMEAASPAE